MRPRFWKHFGLHELQADEWEAICDGCGKCCLQKLEDEDTGEVWYTHVLCQYLSPSCQCTVYPERHVKVPSCVQLTPERAQAFDWLPETCGYRRLAQGKPLPNWHPLLRGERDTMAKKGQSVWQLEPAPVSDASVSEDDWQDYIIGKG